MANPYESLPERNFWRSAVGSLNPFDIHDLHTPKFGISREDVFATAGSCFAQHISRAIVDNGIEWIDAEPPPPGFPDAKKKAFNYGVFSFRTSNIYTTAMLHQWLTWCLDPDSCPTGAWEKDGRFFDAFRPSIEPNGFASVEELVQSRRRTLRAIHTAVSRASVMVFTLGLTEVWRSRSQNLWFAACPGTLAGDFDPQDHEFVNLDYPTTRDFLERSIAMMRSINPTLKVLLTVSPVPLTASADRERHVLVSTTYSKSVLRAVSGDLVAAHDFIDYFPSYEIITAPAYRGIFFEQNMRSVNHYGVDHVMKHFLSSYGLAGPGRPAARPKPPKAAPKPKQSEDDDVVCEEAVLEFFNDK